ncbi:MAG: arsenite efflux transporter metallochaperone ArsD [Phycisphaerae bacterium]|nr:arsenite efflux transporter metallochaperone ArsD [Phycisphaerae bacterium]
MPTVKVFDPPMCCASGVCGSEVDLRLAKFAGDLAWLAGHGVSVERYNLSQQPEAFMRHPSVLQAVNAGGTQSLPIVMIDDRIVAQREYPTRDALAASVGVRPDAPLPVGKSGGCGCGRKGCC